METLKMDIEKTANQIMDSISTYGRNGGDLIDAMDDDFGEKFYEAAKCIVEPDGVDDSYFEFMDNDPENWASWIRELAGENWGAIALWVNQNGY